MTYNSYWSVAGLVVKTSQNTPVLPGDVIGLLIKGAPSVYTARTRARAIKVWRTGQKELNLTCDVRVGKLQLGTETSMNN